MKSMKHDTEKYETCSWKAWILRELHHGVWEGNTVQIARTGNIQARFVPQAVEHHFANASYVCFVIHSFLSNQKLEIHISSNRGSDKINFIGVPVSRNRVHVSRATYKNRPCCTYGVIEPFLEDSGTSIIPRKARSSMGNPVVVNQYEVILVWDRVYVAVQHTVASTHLPVSFTCGIPRCTWRTTAMQHW